MCQGAFRGLYPLDQSRSLVYLFFHPRLFCDVGIWEGSWSCNISISVGCSGPRSCRVRYPKLRVRKATRYLSLVLTSVYRPTTKHIVSTFSRVVLGYNLVFGTCGSFGNLTYAGCFTLLTRKESCSVLWGELWGSSYNPLRVHLHQPLLPAHIESCESSIERYT